MNILPWGRVEPSSSRRRFLAALSPAILGAFSWRSATGDQLPGFPPRKFEPGQRVRIQLMIDDRLCWKEGTIIGFWWGHPLRPDCQQWVYDVLIDRANCDDHLGERYSEDFEQDDLSRI